MAVKLEGELRSPLRYFYRAEGAKFKTLCIIRVLEVHLMNFCYFFLLGDNMIFREMSCDKIRIKYRLSGYFPFRIPEGLPEDYFAELNSKHLDYTGSKSQIGHYLRSYWFRLQDQESNIIVFQGRVNSKCEVDHRDFCIEFNPNKHDLPDFVLSFLKKAGARCIDVVSADFCFDFRNIPVSEFQFDAHGLCQTMTFGRLGGTYARYLSPKARDGRIKIYDKGDERRGKAGELLYKGITRVEISYRSNMQFLIFGDDYELLDPVDLSRLKDMYDSLCRVKVPFFNWGADAPDLNPGHIMAISAFLDRGDAKKAYEYVKACFKSKAPRVRYNAFIRDYEGFRTIYSDVGGVVAYYADLVDCVRSALPVIA